jgi:hypothetical protein
MKSKCGGSVTHSTEQLTPAPRNRGLSGSLADRQPGRDLTPSSVSGYESDALKVNKEVSVNTPGYHWNSERYFKPLMYLVATLAACVGGANMHLDCAYAGDAAAQAGMTVPQVNSLLTPPSLDGEKIPIQIALDVINLSDIDEVAQRFRVVAYLLAKWKDPRLAFVPKAAWERFRVYHPDEVWTPHFDFANGVVPHSASDVTLRVFPDGTVKYYERSCAELSNSSSSALFPIR